MGRFVERIAVIGGGIVGLAIGIDLLDAGRAVVLVDDDEAGQAASWGNAGHSAVEQVAPLASFALMRSVPRRLFLRGGALAFPPLALPQWLPFGLRLLAAAAPARFRHGRDVLRGLLGAAMPAWEALAARIGAPELLRQDGHFVLWETARAAAAGRAGWIAAETGTAQVRDATAADIAMLSRLGTASIAGAIRFSGSGQISDLEVLRMALRAAFTARGGEIARARATLRREGRRAEVPGVDAGEVIVCAGVGSRELLEALGHKVPMIAERGYHIRADIDAARWPPDMPPVVFEDRSMIVTRYHDCVQAASFVELNRPDAPADPRKWARLERHVAALDLPMTGPFRRWMGARPTLPDYLPAIGRSDRVDNLHYAFGHQHLGLTLAPVTARLMTALITGEAPALPLAPLDIRRFA